LTLVPPRDRTSISEVECWRSCNLKRYYRYIYKLELPKSLTAGNNAFGNVMHKALEYLYERHDSKEIRAKIIEDAKAEKMFPDEISCLLSAFKAYEVAVGSSEFDVIGTEYWFDYPALAEYGFFKNIGMKIDLIAKDDNGDFWVIDHKTSKWTVKDDVVPVIEKAKLLWQSALYVKAARDHGIPVKGMVYNIICQPRYRKSKSESRMAFESRVYLSVIATPEKYFTRGYQPMDTEQVNQVLMGFAHDCHAMYADDVAVPNANSCMFGYQYKCEYFEECHETPWDYQLEDKRGTTEGSSTDAKESASQHGQVELSAHSSLTLAGTPKD
jgi:hypothetical protein